MGDDTATVSAETLVKARLAGYAYRTLPETHPLRENLRIPRRDFEMRHQMVKHQFLPLLKAWNAVGLRAMLLKGFWLAEFIYERPGDRGYGDIDVLMPEAQTKLAVEIAQQIGWSVVFRREASANPHSHEDAHIVSSNGLVSIDLHRFALQGIQLWGQHHPKRLTASLWKSAIQQPWEGTTVWLPTPLDGMVINLLNRARGDQWTRRISDLPDARAIVQQSGITLKKFQARATELGFHQTIIAALETCDPWNNWIHCAPPTFWQRLKWYSRTMREIGIYELEHLHFQLDRLVHAINGVWTMLPIVTRVKHKLRHQPDLYQLFQTLEQQYSPKTNTNPKELIRLKRGTYLALLLVGPRKNACVPRSLSLYLALRQRNIHVQFVSGVRHRNHKLEGHAWIEWRGRPLEGFGDHHAPELFKENFRYPPRPDPA